MLVLFSGNRSSASVKFSYEKGTFYCFKSQCHLRIKFNIIIYTLFLKPTLMCDMDSLFCFALPLAKAARRSVAFREPGVRAVMTL